MSDFERIQGWLGVTSEEAKLFCEDIHKMFFNQKPSYEIILLELIQYEGKNPNPKEIAKAIAKGLKGKRYYLSEPCKEFTQNTSKSNSELPQEIATRKLNNRINKKPIKSVLQQKYDQMVSNPQWSKRRQNKESNQRVRNSTTRKQNSEDRFSNKDPRDYKGQYKNI